jgi:hypothetical protein
MVVQEIRLDGALHCDDDFNAALRPWLGIGAQADPKSGFLPVFIDRLKKDSSQVPGEVYTGIGGGPWIIKEREIVPDSWKCEGTTALKPLDHVNNCNYPGVEKEKNKKETSGTTEFYDGGSCRATSHTAAGYTKDGRWLFLVVSSSKSNPLGIANFLKDQLGVWQALKFDGGGSAKLLFKGTKDIFQMPDPDPGERPLSNYLAVYSPRGKGIRLPLEAEPKKRVIYQVVNAGETARAEVEFVNTGPLTWHPDDGVQLREEPWKMLSPVIETQPLPGSIAPGQTALWAWETNTSGVLVRRFQMVQKNEPFGDEATVIIVVLPKGFEDKRQEIERKIQEIIDEWEKNKDATIDELIQRIVKYVEGVLNNIITIVIVTVTNAIKDFIAELLKGCGLPAVFLIALTVFITRFQKCFRSG